MSLAHELAQEINNKWKRIIEEKRNQRWRASGIRASELFHPCEAYIYFSITQGEEGEPYTAETVERMMEGSFQEKNIRLWLAQVGLELLEVDRGFREEKFNIVGRIDGLLRRERKIIVAEIKTTEQDIDSLNSWEDLAENIWMKKWVGQTLIYEYGLATEEGLIILKERGKFKLKALPVVLDFAGTTGAMLEEGLKKAERINRALEKGEVPQRIGNPELCVNCPFQAICKPELNWEGYVEVLNSELDKILDEIDRLDKIVADLGWKGVNDIHNYREKLRKKAQAILEKIEGEEIVTERFIVKKKKWNRTIYNIPSEVKQKYKEQMEGFRFTFERIVGE